MIKRLLHKSLSTTRDIHDAFSFLYYVQTFLNKNPDLTIEVRLAGVFFATGVYILQNTIVGGGGGEEWPKGKINGSRVKREEKGGGGREKIKNPLRKI